MHPQGDPLAWEKGCFDRCHGRFGPMRAGTVLMHCVGRACCHGFEASRVGAEKEPAGCLTGGRLRQFRGSLPGHDVCGRKPGIAHPSVLPCGSPVCWKKIIHATLTSVCCLHMRMFPRGRAAGDHRHNSPDLISALFSLTLIPAPWASRSPAKEYHSSPSCRASSR